MYLTDFIMSLIPCLYSPQNITVFHTQCQKFPLGEASVTKSYASCVPEGEDIWSPGSSIYSYQQV